MTQNSRFVVDETPLTVLHIDDDADFADLVSLYLEKELTNATILTETNPIEAIEIVKEQDIDCVVSDFDMPQMNGLEFLAKVRNISSTLPFILFTGKGSEEIASDAIDAGVTSYMQKESSKEQFTMLANKVVTAVNAAWSEEERRVLRTGVEQVDSAVAVANKAGELQYVNQKFSDLTSVSQQTLFEEPVCLFDVLDDIGFDEGVIRAQLSGDGVWIDQSNGYGDTIPARYRVTDISDPKGEIAKYAITVTEQQSGAVLDTDSEAVLNRISDGFFSLNTDWEFTYVNPAAESLLGYSAERLLGETLQDMFPEVESTVFGEKYQEALDSQCSLSFTSYYEPLNSTFTVRVYPSESGLSVYFDEVDASQRQDMALSELYEITSDPNCDFEEKINEVLRVGREYLGVDYGLVNKVTRDTLEVEYSNSVDGMFEPGMTCDIGKSYCRRAVLSDDLLGVYNAVEEGWDSDPVYDEFELSCYIGSKLLIDNNIFGTVCFVGDAPRKEPFTEEEKHFVEVLSQWVSYEMEMNQNRERLRSENAYLREFASFVAHDLRNPLTIANGNLDLLEETKDFSHVDDIRSSMSRIDQIITDVLDLARDGQQVSAEDLEQVSLRDVAEDSWENIETEEATLECRTDYVVEADRGKLKQLFENLFRNAVTHGGSGVTVTVGMTCGGGFYVSDDGPGVSEDDLEDLFEMGYTTDSGGSGLGLAIVERITAAHNWDIKAKNGVDGGLRFDITHVWVPDDDELRNHLNVERLESLGD